MRLSHQCSPAAWLSSFINTPEFTLATKVKVAQTRRTNSGATRLLLSLVVPPMCVFLCFVAIS